MKKIFTSAAWLILLVMVGCVSTPARRIQKNPELFASFPPEIQAKVKKGEVEIGFTKDMTRLALGNPAHIRNRKTSSEQVEIWIYTRYNYISHYEPMDSGYWYRDRAGYMRRSYDTMWVEHHYTEEFPVLRLDFENDKIKAIERLNR